MRKQNKAAKTQGGLNPEDALMDEFLRSGLK